MKIYVYTFSAVELCFYNEKTSLYKHKLRHYFTEKIVISIQYGRIKKGENEMSSNNNEKAGTVMIAHYVMVRICSAHFGVAADQKEF